MAGSKGSKYYDVFLRFKIWLDKTDGVCILDGSKIELLQEIEKQGSLKAAAKNAGISYRKAWDIIRHAEHKLGFPLIHKMRGGVQGGGSSLTEDGQKLVSAYIELNREFDEAIYRITKKFFHKINKD